MKTNPLDDICHIKDLLFSFYERRGWQLIPLHSVENQKCTCKNSLCASPAKHPLSQHGLKDASSDSKQIEQWWSRWPFANIGIVTGKKSGIVVLDIDAKNNGFDGLAALEKKYGTLPASLRVRTGGGGLHIYFRAPKFELRNRTGLVPGIDFRGEGGYVVAPPSKHISDSCYEFIDGNASICEMPDWLEELLSRAVVNLSDNSDGKIPEGQRNQTLMSISGFLLSKGIGLPLIHEVITKINLEGCVQPLNNEELLDIASSTKKFKIKNAWPDLKPLPEYDENCIALKPENLPRTILPWVLDTTERMQVPLEFVSAPLIIAAGAVIGRKASLRPLMHDPWSVFPNLWGFLVAAPGSMKSPAIAEALKPLEHLAAKASKKFAQECEQAQVEFRKLSVEIEALKQSLRIDLSGGFVDGLAQEKAQLCELQEKAETTKNIKEKRYKTNDPTVEKLAMIMKDNPQGVLLLRDELSGWLESLYKTGREGSREFYLEAWNGNSPFSIDRVGRGTIHVEALCLSIFGGIQPTKLSEYIDHHSNVQGDDGFLERFQIVFYPELEKGWQLIDREANKEAFTRLMAAFEELDALELKKAPTTFCFGLEAQEIANRWRCGLEQRLRHDNLSPMMKSHLSKYRSLMPSLALIFALLETGRKTMEVDLVSTRRAITWCSILESHTAKIFQKTLHNPMISAQILGQKIKKGCLKDQETVRDLRRRCWAGLRTSEQIESAISTLQLLGWIRIEAITGKGGTSEFIRINPLLIKGDA